MAASLSAQSVLSTKAGLVSDGGEVYMDDRRVEISPSGIVMVNENAVLRTGAGKAEVLLGPCAAIWIDENSSFRLISNDIIDTRIEWLTGSAVVGAGAFQGGAQITVQLRAVSVLVRRKGAYRFNSQSPGVKVLAGKTIVHWENRDIPVTAGWLLTLDASARVSRFDRRNTDLLNDWSKSRAAYLVRAWVPQKEVVPGPSDPLPVNSRRGGVVVPRRGIPPLPNSDSGCSIPPW